VYQHMTSELFRLRLYLVAAVSRESGDLRRWGTGCLCHEVELQQSPGQIACVLKGGHLRASLESPPNSAAASLITAGFVFPPDRMEPPALVTPILMLSNQPCCYQGGRERAHRVLEAAVFQKLGGA
jgi:hypothetical protein